jgi:hypothetical protein
MPASNQFTASARAARGARLAPHTRWAQTPDQTTVTAAPVPDPWLIVEFPAPALGLSSWDDVLAIVTNGPTTEPNDETGLVAA